MRLGPRARRSLLIAWKDLLDLKRDTRTLLGIIILPFIGLPGLALLAGVLASQQQVAVCVVLNDTSPLAREVASRVAERTVDILRGWGFQASLAWGRETGCDLVVLVPKGFSSNLSSLGSRAMLIASTGLGGAGQQALMALEQAVREVSEQVAAERVGRLAGMAGVTLSPEAVLHPIQVSVRYHTAGGAPATGGMVRASETARVLAFSLFFVVNPVVVFMSDAIAGERERRTLEMLLIGPVGRAELLAGKVLAASVAGLLGAAADSAGILAYFALSGLPVEVTMGLSLVWFASALGLIVFTAFTAGVISSRAGSMRASQNLSFLVTMLAMSIYFAALIVDFTRLPRGLLTVLSAIPFAQAALALEYYSVGLPRLAALYVGLLALSSGVAGLALSRLFDYERVVAGSR